MNKPALLVVVVVGAFVVSVASVVVFGVDGVAVFVEVCPTVSRTADKIKIA